MPTLHACFFIVKTGFQEMMKMEADSDEEEEEDDEQEKEENDVEEKKEEEDKDEPGGPPVVGTFCFRIHHIRIVLPQQSVLLSTFFKHFN